MDYGSCYLLCSGDRGAAGSGGIAEVSLGRRKEEGRRMNLENAVETMDFSDRPSPSYGPTSAHG
jgi:hypothetical protein